LHLLQVQAILADRDCRLFQEIPRNHDHPFHLGIPELPRSPEVPWLQSFPLGPLDRWDPSVLCRLSHLQDLLDPAGPWLRFLPLVPLVRLTPENLVVQESRGCQELQLIPGDLAGRLAPWRPRSCPQHPQGCQARLDLLLVL
jgi:hypothetical protein